MRRRRKAAKKAPQTGGDENTTIHFEAGKTSPLRMINEVRKPFKGPSGRGLGKAGAKRLGRMLVQAMQPGEEPRGRGKVSLPKTPIGLLEYHLQAEANNASETDSPTLPSPQVSRFIGQAVSKYKQEGGISMAELKQMLAAEGYDVSKTNRQVTVVPKKLVNDETLVRTTRSASSRLNNKADTSRVNTNTVKSQKPNKEVKQNTTVHKFPKRAEESQQRGKKTPTPRRKSPKSKSKTDRAPGKSHKQPSMICKRATKFQEQRKTPKANKKVTKPAGKKSRSAKKQATQPQKPVKRTKRTPRRQAKKVQHPYKTRKRQPPRRKRPITRLRLRSQQRRDTRRTHYN